MSKVETTHESVAELLPWYAAGSLSKEEHQLVESHLSACTHCAQSLQGWRNLSTAVNTAASPPAWSPNPGHFASLTRQIDSMEKAKRGPRSSLADRIAGWFNLAPTGMRWAVALQGVAIMALAGILWRQSVAPNLYETYSNAPSVSTTAPRLRVVFQPEASERDIRAVLQALDANIVAGPSAIGVYTVAVGGSDAAVQSKALTALRGSAIVRLAEPDSSQQ